VYFAGEPVSRILSWTAIPLDAALLPAFISDLPGGFRFRQPKLSERPALAHRAGTHLQALGSARRFPPYLVLLRVGFTLPPRFTAGAVRSYRTFSPLPRCLRSAAVSSLWH
jgi:hypothetical protein